MDNYNRELVQLQAFDKISEPTEALDSAFQAQYMKCLQCLQICKLKNENGEIYRPLVIQLREIKEKWTQKHKALYTRRYKLADENLSDRDVERLWSARIDPAQVLQESIMTDNDRLQDVIDDLENRRNKILKLEEAVLSVHQDMITLSILTESQQPALDNIEKKIEKASENVSKGAKSLRNARKQQTSAGNKRFAILCCLLFVLLVILVPLFSLAKI